MLGHKVFCLEPAQTAKLEMLCELYDMALFKITISEMDNVLKSERFDSIYSRFSLHSVSSDDQNRLLDYCKDHLNRNGRLFIEVRSTEDALYGQGKKVEEEKNAFMTDHYRRFVDQDELLQALRKRGYCIVESVKGKGLAVKGNEDPIVIRVIAYIK
ncbi:hypothetical protein MHBO_000885 [Bonamia ostreae]|uniref:Methyltransferase type 11 domain-containing protein n=1 Tax=Bonamia ostreae TaxID=126728 RepID=A0ABV2AH65_9EUKA